MNTYPLGQALRHLDLDITGIVESEVPIVTHFSNLRRERVNVRVGEDDLVWWDVTRVAVVGKPSPTPAPLTVPANEPVTTLALL